MILSTIIIILSAFAAAYLTLLTGFGLATLLTPVIALFFPLDVAIAMTAFVHLLNNFLKFFLLYRDINWNVTLKFGLPAIVMALLGAVLLNYTAQLPPLLSYQIYHKSAEITLLKLLVGILLIFFATVEWQSYSKKIYFDKKWLPLGGLISGFFGGLTGLQGALRTPFLLHIGLTKEQFIATNAGIAILVDVTRLLVYSINLRKIFLHADVVLIFILTTGAALLGTQFAVRHLKSVSFDRIKKLIVGLLYLIAVLLIAGLI